MSDHSFIDRLKSDIHKELGEGAALVQRADDQIAQFQDLDKTLQSEADRLRENGEGSAALMSEAFSRSVDALNQLEKDIAVSLERLIYHGSKTTKDKARELFEVAGPGSDDTLSEHMYNAAHNTEGAEDIIEYLSQKAFDLPGVMEDVVSGHRGFLPELDDGGVDPDYIGPDEWSYD